MNATSASIGLLGAAVALLCGYWVMRVCERANQADWGGKWLNRLDGLNRIFCRKFHRLQADPVPLPAEEGALVAANHVSGLDPLLMVAACRRPLRFIIAVEEYNRWWLRWLFKLVRLIPVERSKDPQKALYAARKALEAGEVVALFPQGGIHLEGEPVRFKRGVVLLAAMTGVPIYPLRVEGVRGQGKLVKAVFIRSRARIRSFSPIYCDTENATAQLKKLEEEIGGLSRC